MTVRKEKGARLAWSNSNVKNDVKKNAIKWSCGAALDAVPNLMVEYINKGFFGTRQLWGPQSASQAAADSQVSAFKALRGLLNV